MSFLQTLRIAILALVRNRLRSFLTALGVMIGVAAVIAMVAIGDGAKARVEAAFQSMGSNMLVVMSGTHTAGGAHGGFGSQPTLTWDDLKAILTEVPSVRAASPQLRATVQIVSEEMNWTTSVSGVSPDFFVIRSWPASSGSLFTQSDSEGGGKVALLGQTASDNLFGAGVDPIGKTVRIKNSPFVVIGLLARKGQSPMGQDYDDAAFIPYTAFVKQIQGGLQKYIQGGILIGARPDPGATATQKDVTALLRDRHRITPGDDDDFSIRNLAEMAAAQQEGTNTLTTLLASIAAVSLLVGGIGIMNIMLVSVTERTREIGLRMAVGATPNEIMLQFLVEALTLSVTGGVLGIILGLSGATFLAGRFGWPMLVRGDIIGIAIGFSALVGVGFGLYPARRASQLDPITALRYE